MNGIFMTEMGMISGNPTERQWFGSSNSMVVNLYMSILYKSNGLIHDLDENWAYPHDFGNIQFSIFFGCPSFLLGFGK